MKESITDRILFLKGQINYFEGRMQKRKNVADPSFFINAINIYKEELKGLEEEYERQNRQ